jgi:hypothetical protein
MVKKDILEALKARKASGKARSVYEATQQALIAGVASWSKKAKSA